MDTKIESPTTSIMVISNGTVFCHLPAWEQMQAINEEYQKDLTYF